MKIIRLTRKGGSLFAGRYVTMPEAVNLVNMFDDWFYAGLHKKVILSSTIITFVEETFSDSTIALVYLPHNEETEYQLRKRSIEYSFKHMNQQGVISRETYVPLVNIKALEAFLTSLVPHMFLKVELFIEEIELFNVKTIEVQQVWGVSGKPATQVSFNGYEYKQFLEQCTASEQESYNKVSNLVYVIDNELKPQVELIESKNGKGYIQRKLLALIEEAARNMEQEESE